MTAKKNVLIFVYIDTHFREMVRLARLLKLSDKYQPIIFFRTAYEGSQKDIETCKYENIKTMVPNEFKSSKVKTHFRFAWISNAKIRKLGERFLTVFYELVKIVNLYFVRVIKKIFSVIFYGIFRLARASLKTNIRCPRPIKAALNPLILCLLDARVVRKTWGLAKFFQIHKHHSLSETVHDIYSSYNMAFYIFQKYKIDLLVLPEDNIFYLTPFYISFAKQKNIPTVIVPFTIVNSKEWAEAFFKNPSTQLSNGLNAAVAKKYPRWVYRYKETSLILPIKYILTLEYLRLVPPIPWLINSGYADYIAVESNFMKSYNQRAGIEESKMVVTGALYDDVLATHLENTAAKKIELYQELKINNDLPMLLCALPPDQINTGRVNCVFKKYEDLVSFWVETLESVSHAYNVVISLHPRIKRESVAFIEEYNIKISDRNIAELVPLSKTFVASCSATIRLAIGCGIPVINYDVYHYHYDDYNEAKGVLTFTSKNDFVANLKAFADDADFYNTVKSAQQSVMREWAILDGQCSTRMLNLFDSVVGDR